MTQITFSELGLAQPLLDALTASGYTEPTPVQAAAIPRLMARKDVMASAATGTGKTAAFMLPALNMLMENKPGRGPRILVLSPTRELAAQIKTAAETYGKQIRHAKVVSIVGGMPYPLQIKLLAAPYEILVATPGRLLDMMARGRIDFGRLDMLVLDEADRMLDLGFRDDIAEIASKLPKTRVTALFSATLDGDIAKIASTLLNEPERIEIAAPANRQEQIVEKLHYADDVMHKTRLLDRILEDEAVGQAIVFIATKIDADSLADKLFSQGKKVAALHGDMQQRERQRTLNRLKAGDIDILVATDVAARGIDVAGITHVVNFDLPKFAEDYVHRIGRTGRAGREGIAISFAAKHEVPALRRIEKFVGRKLVSYKLDGLEARFEPRPGMGGGAGKPRFGDKPRGDRFGGPSSGDRFGGGNRGGFAGRDSQPRTFGDRPARDARPAFGDRSAAPASAGAGAPRGYGDRAAFGQNRGSERPAYGVDRAPYRGNDNRSSETREVNGNSVDYPQRPAYGAPAKPAYPRGDRPAGPARSFDSRPARDGNRAPSAPRTGGTGRRSYPGASDFE